MPKPNPAVEKPLIRLSESKNGTTRKMRQKLIQILQIVKMKEKRKEGKKIEETVFLGESARTNAPD